MRQIWEEGAWNKKKKGRFSVNSLHNGFEKSKTQNKKVSNGNIEVA